jgi:hypothetical protein
MPMQPCAIAFGDDALMTAVADEGGVVQVRGPDAPAAVLFPDGRYGILHTGDGHYAWAAHGGLNGPTTNDATTSPRAYDADDDWLSILSALDDTAEDARELGELGENT